VQEGESGRSVKVTTDLHPVLSVRMYGAIIILDHTPLCHKE